MNSDISLAFARGSDARLAGLPLSACPYHGNENKVTREYWTHGWQHVDNQWGIDAKWYVRPLPLVQEGAA